jgi:hypothetical protein
MLANRPSLRALTNHHIHHDASPCDSRPIRGRES